MSVDLTYNSYLPKPGASKAVKKACTGKSRRHLTGYGKTLVGLSTLASGNFIASMYLWISYGAGHHVNSWPEAILTVGSLVGAAVTALSAADSNARYTTPSTPKNFEQQTIVLTSSTRPLLEQKQDIIENFTIFAPEQLPNVTNMIDSAICEIFTIETQQAELTNKVRNLSLDSGKHSQTLLKIIKQKQVENTTAVQTLRENLTTLEALSYEAACVVDLALESGQKPSPINAPASPTPQLEELNSWLGTYTTAYTKVAI